MLKLRVKQVTYESNILWQHKKAKAARYSAMDLKNLCILPENSAEGFMSRRKHCGSYIVSAFQNIPKNLLVQGRMQLEHISHIKVGVKATYTKTSTPDPYWRKQPNRQSHLELCHRKADFLESMLNRITLFNSTAGYCLPMQVEK